MIQFKYLISNIIAIFSFVFLFANLTYAQPANDEPCNATDLGLLVLNTPTLVTGGTNVAATNSSFSTKATQAGGYAADMYLKDVWYKFKLPNGYFSTKVTLTTTSGKKFTMIQNDKQACTDDGLIKGGNQPAGQDYLSTDVVASAAGSSFISVRTSSNCMYTYKSGTFQNGDYVYLSVGGATASDLGTFDLKLEVYGNSGGGCPSCSGLGTMSISGTGTIANGVDTYDISDGGTVNLTPSGYTVPTGQLIGIAFFSTKPTLPLTVNQLADLTTVPGYKGSDYFTSNTATPFVSTDNNTAGKSATIPGSPSTVWAFLYLSDQSNAVDGDKSGDVCIGTLIQLNYTLNPPPTCSSCGSATCKVVVSNGATLAAARAQSTTDIAVQVNSASAPALGNVINLKDDGQSVTVCVPVTVPADATSLGFKHGFYKPNGGCTLSDPDITRSYTLVPAGCSSPAINPKTANGSNVGSGFNPEWDVVKTGAAAGKILPGNYIFCYTMSIASGSMCSSVPNLVLGYYTNGTLCAADNGTSTVKINGTTPPASKNPAKNEYILCYNDVFDVTTTGATPSVDYGIFVSAPTSNDVVTQNKTSFTTNYFFNTLNTMSETSKGDASGIFTYIKSLSGVPNTITKNTIWWAPITTATAGSLSDSNCYNMDYVNEAYKVTYLNDITITKNEICASSKVTLTITGGSPEYVTGSNYTISTNKGTLSATSLSASGGTVDLTGLNTNDAYTITVTDGVGCTKTFNGTYTCACTAPTVTGLTELCVGGTLTLTGSGTLAVASPWVAQNAKATISGTGQTVTITGVTAGTCDITYKDNNGCTATQTVTVNGNPTITANPTSFLVGATSAISVAGGSGSAATVNPWVSSSTANATIVGAGQSATVTGVSAGNSNIIYTDNKGCDDTVQVTVTIPGCKTINNPSPALVLCQGADPSAFNVSTSETAVNGINYVVYPAITKPANAAAVYSGVGTSGISLSKVTPTAGVATLDLPSLGTVGSLPVVIAGDYYVYAILDPVPSDVNCRPYAEIKVTIKDSVVPVVTATPILGDSTVFSWNNNPAAPKWGVEGALTLTNALPATWINLGSFPNAAGGAPNKHTTPGIPLGQTAHIKITPQDNTGVQLACSNTAGASITNPNCTKPIPLALTAPSAVCEGASINVIGGLNATSVLANFKWRISLDGTNWTDVSGVDYDITTVPSTFTIPVSKISMKNAKVKLIVTDQATGACKDSTLAVPLTINELPNASLSINPDPAVLCVGANQLITVTFIGNKGNAPYIFDYTLDGTVNKDSSLVGSSVLTYDFNTNNQIVDSTFILTKVTDKFGCSKVINTNNTVKMQVIPAPQPVFTADQTVGCFPFTVIFTDKSTSLNTKVEWDFGDGSPVSTDLGFTKYTFKKAGDYSISFKSIMNGCSDTMLKTNYIHVKDRPTAQFSPKKTNISMIEPVVNFINSSSNNAVSFKWVFGDGSPISMDKNPMHTFIGQGSNDLPAPGKYKVELYAYVNQDCWDSTSTTITIDDEQIYYIPNTFTPNGDEKNNDFQPVFTSGFDAQNYHFSIFNRWGELVFESNNPAIGWDGTYGNKIVMNGTFTWKLQFKEKMTEKEHYLTGHVNLIK